MREITAIVLGASGLVGKELVLQLLNDQRFAKIRAITRTPLSVQHHKLEACLVNFDDEVSFRELMREGSVVFCALGTTMRKVKGDKQVYRRIDFEIPFKAASWGLENQVRRFVLVSAVGAGSGSANFYLRLKGELEDKIASMPFDVWPLCGLPCYWEKGRKPGHRKRLRK